MFKKKSLLAAAMAWALSAAALAQSAQLSFVGTPDPVQPGQVVNVDVMLTGAQDLFAFQFDVAFNGSLLQATSSTEGSLLATGGETYGDAGTIDSTMGNVSNVFYTLVGNVPGVNGSGSLLHLSFVAQSLGTASLTISNALFLDSAGNDISVTVQSGLVHITAVPEPASLSLLLTGLGLVAWRRRHVEST